MANFSFGNIRIAGISTAVPKTVVKAQDFAPEWGEEQVRRFVDMTGIECVRRTSAHQTCSDLGFVAAENLIASKKIEREAIGLLVFASGSGDYRRPATACVLHHRLRLAKGCASFDVGLGCSGFVYAVQVAASMMANSDVEKALVIIGETVSKLANDKDRSVAMLFGDAGCAVLLEKGDGEISGSLYSDGSGFKAIIAPAGGFRNMDADDSEFEFPDGSRRSLHNIWMDGMSVFTFTISDVPKSIKEYMEWQGTTVDSYDCFAMHQANKYIHLQLAKKLKISAEKMPLSLDRFGNTSGASIPLTLCDSFGAEDKSRVIKMLACGFGVGLSWGVLATTVNTTDILPIAETDECYEEGLIKSPEDWKNE